MADKNGVCKSANGVVELKHVIDTERCGQLNIYVQGDLSQQDKRAVFLTVHDLGCNHTSFHDFVDHPSMANIKERSVFIHVDVPGQEDNAPNLGDDFQFPTMQTLGEDLVTVLDTLHVKYIIGLGEGAGAIILARFALAHPSRCLGLILLNCTGNTASVMDFFKDKFMSWKIGSASINPSAEQYLVFHKFGHQLDNDPTKDKEKLVQEFQQKLRSTINHNNLKKYVNAFMNRKDLTAAVKNLKIDTLLVTGANSSQAGAVSDLYSVMDKSKVTVLKVDGVGDVINEVPEKLAQSILLHCKGLGQLTSIAMPGIDRQRSISVSSTGSDGKPVRRLSRGMSMEEYDKPNLRRLSVTKNEYLSTQMARTDE